MAFWKRKDRHVVTGVGVGECDRDSTRIWGDRLFCILMEVTGTWVNTHIKMFLDVNLKNTSKSSSWRTTCNTYMLSSNHDEAFKAIFKKKAPGKVALMAGDRGAAGRGEGWCAGTKGRALASSLQFLFHFPQNKVIFTSQSRLPKFHPTTGWASLARRVEMFSELDILEQSYRYTSRCVRGQNVQGVDEKAHLGDERESTGVWGWLPKGTGAQCNESDWILKENHILYYYSYK